MTLTSCVLSAPPGKDQLAQYIEEQSDDGSYSLESFDVIQENTSEDKKAVYYKGQATFLSENQTHNKIEIWSFRCRYENGAWLISDAGAESSDYQLLVNLSEEECRVYLSEYAPEDFTINYLETDRENKFAVATINYQTSSNSFSQLNEVIVKANAVAEFSWSPWYGWTVDDYRLSDDTEYTYNGSCHIKYTRDRNSLFESTGRTMSFDISIKDNVVEITNGLIGSTPSIRFTNVEIADGSGLNRVNINFDYQWDRDDSEVRSGRGQLTFYSKTARGNGDAVHLSMEKWDYNGWWDTWSDWGNFVEWQWL